MANTLVCRTLAAAGMLALAGCAQEGVRPSYLGLSDMAESGELKQRSPGSAEIPEELRHVQSNRVLGAMAFQRITGRTVDPDSLVRSDNP